MGSSKKARNRLADHKEAPREVELKLEIEAGAVGRLLDHPLVARAQPDQDQSGHLSAVYFDTPDLDLRKSGLSLRIRRRNGNAVQTIKAEDKSRGLALDRSEWEQAVDDQLDFGAAAGTPLARLIAKKGIRDSIRPVFGIETERRAFTVEHDGALVELALDNAAATAGDSMARFAELELELKQGAPAALFRLAHDLAKAAPLRLAPVTKSERGYGLLERARSAPVHAQDVAIDADASCAEAFQIIARSCVSQMIANESVLRRSPDPEALHQIRVGLRRLRAAISLFRKMLARQETEAVKQGLRWIGRKLGPARDLDVLLGNLREAAGSPDVENAIADTERRRLKAYAVLQKALDTPRYMSAILETAAWIEAGQWLGNEKRTSRPARKHAAKELSRRHKKIVREAKHLEELPDEERHELRIRIKKMRYGTEFFASLFERKKARKRRKAMLKGLEHLQDLLGEMNDIAVGSAMVPSLAQSDPERAEQRLAKLLSKAVVAAHDLPGAKPFWK